MSRLQQAWESVEQLEQRVCLAYAIADWFPLTGGNEWGQGAQIDGMPGTGVTRSTAGVAVGSQTATRLRSEFQIFNEMYGYTEERFAKLAASGMRLLQVNRWGEFGSQSIRYLGGGALLTPPNVEVGDVFTYSNRFTATTDRGMCSGTATGTVRIEGIENSDGAMMSSLRFNTLKVVRTEVLTGTGEGWTTQIDLTETHWLARGYGTVKWTYEQRIRSSDGTDQTTNLDVYTHGGNLLSAIIGLRVQGPVVPIHNYDKTVSFEEGTNFGVIDVNGQYGISNFVIANTSPRPMTINRVFISGRDNADFKITRSPVGELMPGDVRTLRVRFDPIAAGIRVARVVIESSDPAANPFTFRVQGEGVLLGTINVRETSKATPINAGSTAPSWALGTAFGSVSVTDAYVDRTFIITNTGPGDLRLLKPVFVRIAMNAEAAPPPFYVLTQPMSNVIAPMASATFVVRFNPHFAGVVNAFVGIETNDRHTPLFEFAIRGTGV